MNTAQHLIFVTAMTLSLSSWAQNNTQPAPEETVQPTEAAPAEPQAQVEVAAPAPTPEEEIPASQASLLKSAATKEFNKALYFDQIDNGVILPPMEIDYEMTADGKALRMGNTILNEKTFFFALTQLGKAHPKLAQVLNGAENNKFALVMAWPEKLMSHGTLEMISRTGTVLWSYTFTEADRQAWQKRVNEWRASLLKKGVPATEVARTGIFASTFAIPDVEVAKAPFWSQRESFRFCLSFSEGRNQSKLCSQRYGSKSEGRQVMMGKVRTDATTPRVLVQNEEAPLKNAAVVPDNMPAAFFAELSTGESYEFVSVPNKLQMMDIADTKNPRLLRVVGYDTRPLQKNLILNPDQYGSLTKALGFEATIGDPRKFWAAAIKKDDPKLFLPGQGGGIFRQRFELSEIPRRQSRVYLHKDSPKGTYNDNIKIFGRKQPISKIATDQNSVTVDERDPANFTWRFKATERGEINRSYLDVEFNGKTYRSYYELYKGYPRELSGRFTGVQSSSGFIFLGEVAYNQWFEDIFTWTNYWLSRQRWGISGRYFQSFNQIKVDTAGNTAPLSVWNVDLKYRGTPGLWGRDETVGGLISYQNVTFDQLKAPMLGVGAFWARSMPKVFDDMFNVFSFMNYPKWVDMDFVYYVQSMDSAITLNSSMALNFHGKVLWSQRIFGEAGFGIKRYAFQNASINQKAELNAFYGTIGLGINF
ncbi:hypothetical protein [Bdellovibrio sp. HCB2-146]|uniref:hypothetical protein n=1 Tax=Bdellovibrio sp. HCB2-146 TaxID=3394362 RepID=UPI0039BC7CD6